MYFLCMLILFTNKIQLTFVFQKIHFFLRLPWPRNQLCMYYFRNKKNKYFFHTIMKLAFINNIKICKKMLVLLCTLPVSSQLHACILCNIVDKF